MKKKIIYAFVGLLIFIVGIWIGQTQSPTEFMVEKLQECINNNKDFKSQNDTLVKTIDSVSNNFRDMCKFYHANCSELPFPQTK